MQLSQKTYLGIKPTIFPNNTELDNLLVFLNDWTQTSNQLVQLNLNGQRIELYSSRGWYTCSPAGKLLKVTNHQIIPAFYFTLKGNGLCHFIKGTVKTAARSCMALSRGGIHGRRCQNCPFRFGACAQIVKCYFVLEHKHV